VNGIRAVVRKGAVQDFIKRHDPDIFCIQETKAEQGQAEIDISQYKEYWNSSKNKKGYSGTAIFTKIEPLNVINDLPEKYIKSSGLAADNYGDANGEGRVIAAEFKDFYVVTAYTPNAKDDLTRIPLRQDWDKAMTAYCADLQNGDFHLDAMQGSNENRTNRTSGTESETRRKLTQQSAKSASGITSSTSEQASAVKKHGKPVIYCGDMNVAHTEDDLANPKPNIGKKGFTNEERSGFDNWLAAGFVDTFRLFTKGNGHYTWWSHFANARARNVGWRIDYVLVSTSLKSKVTEAAIHAEVMGSDHCPVSLTLDN
jgi:exodeoxyribonuclease-3